MKRFLVALLVLSLGLPCVLAQEAGDGDTTTPPAGLEAQAPVYDEMPLMAAAAAVENAVPTKWRTYKDFAAWHGRDHATLLALGMTQGLDYFVHPTAALQSGIPDDTAVVLITANSNYNNTTTRNRVNHPDAQSALASFLSRGGVLIVDMADNDDGGGYFAPGATGTANDEHPWPCRDVTLDPAAVVALHPFTVGLDNSNIDMISNCSVAHGHLASVIPGDATVLMTADFSGGPQPVLAEYCFQGGCVIVNTLTLGYVGHNPYGYGPGFIMTNLFDYAMSSVGQCGNHPPVASCQDVTVDAGAGCVADASIDNGSYDPDGDSFTIDQDPPGPYPLGDTLVTLTITDEYGASDTCTATVTVQDTTPPVVSATTPSEGDAVQDGITLKAEASDNCGVTAVSVCLREADGSTGTPIGYENLPATFNTITELWEYPFDTTLLLDGYYVVIAKATDSHDNEGISEPIPFSIQNWAVVELLPSSESNKAGRTMPVKFSIRIVDSVDPAMPFVHNEGLEIRIYETSEPDTILQISTFGDTAKAYRIQNIEELYITNFKTTKELAEYIVEIWRPSKNFLVGTFTFETVK